MPLSSSTLHWPLLCALVAPLALGGCGKKEVVVEAPKVGWQTEVGWPEPCYYPPDFSVLNTSDRIDARQETLTQIKKQWLGQGPELVNFTEYTVENVETVLLSRPELIERVSQENLTYCKQFMAAGGTDAGTWTSWFNGLTGALMAGQCTNSLINTYFDYLNIGGGWQLEVGICKGESARIVASSKDRYRIESKGEWITAEGDPNRKTIGLANFPCNIEGCLAGMLIGRFKPDDGGVEVIFPIGLEKVYTAPAHGTLSVRINDDTLYDNTYYQSGSIVDHTSLELGPVTP